MAAGLAIGLANSVLAKLGEVAAEKAWDEASLLLNFRDDFKWLQKNLKQICSSLKAADEQTEHSEDVKEWLVEVRNIAFDAEDIIDECSVEHLYTSSSSQSCVCSCSQLLFRYKMAKRIKELKERMNSTVEAAQRLKLFHDVSHLSQPSTSTSESERGAGLRIWSIVDKDAPAVAIDYKVDEIQELLESPALPVIAVVGMGGVGKTFLLQHVFNRSKHRYDCSAWISVSQTCSLRKLQCDLASHIHFEIDSGVSDLRAAELIHEKLDGRRCLIVLDDVWRTSLEGNLISRLGLPTGRDSQCKIVITTRSRDVGQNMNAHIYEMEHLSEEESWELFCQFAFRDRKGNKPPQQLERLGRQIVEECRRLPLALKTVAASLANSSLTTSDWEYKLGQLKKLRNTEDSTMKVLKLSYDSLPPTLKSCFAYLSFFPEDTYISFSSFKAAGADIYLDYVIYLWIAEGYIPQQIDREQWDIGLDYVHHFVNLCLLEVSRVYRCYTIHDMLLDLAVNICKEHDCEFSLPSEEISCRRLLVAKKDVATNEISERPLNCQRVLRTLSLSGNSGITRIPEQLLDHARMLRVVDFSHTSIATLPRYVGKLKLLKVLNLSYTQIREVPDCVRKLKSLQYLDVSYCKLQCLPEWIGELKSLSYLNVEWISDEGTVLDMPMGMSQLSCLRTVKSDLFTLSFDENELFSVKDVGKLTSLQEIRFAFKDVRVLRSAEDGAFDGLVKMRILGVSNHIPDVMEGDREESTSLPTFPEKMKLMKDLQQLYLVRFSIPSWICEMQNLTDLFLRKCNGYSSLQKMPNLRKLILEDDLKCRELPEEFGEREGFPKLEILVITNFPVLEELPALEEGAMQCLELLVINNCPQVKSVPEGLEKLRRLKRIDVVGNASGELKERLKEDGEDWKKIKAKNFRIEIYC